MMVCVASMQTGAAISMIGKLSRRKPAFLIPASYSRKPKLCMLMLVIRNVKHKHASAQYGYSFAVIRC